MLHAFPRMLGYVFNPVSFWVCHDRAGAVRAVLCEVCNTFGEQHNYLLAHPDGRALVSGETLRGAQGVPRLAVLRSRGQLPLPLPFRRRALAGAHRLRRRRGRAVARDLDLGKRDAALAAHGVRGLLWRYRWFTLGVIARIHWQAARLWLKRVPYVAKPQPPLQRTTR